MAPGRGAALLVAALAGGCAPSPVETAASAGCGPERELHVLVQEWHAGLVIPARDLVARLPALAPTLDAAGLVEIGWGDAAFYRAADPSLGLALRAVLYPTTSVLHVVAVPRAALDVRAGGGTLLTLTVPEPGYERLLDHVADTFARGPDGGPVALEAGLYGESRFYRAEGSFHAFNTCNTWVARAVAATGFPVRGSPVTAGGLLDALRRPAAAPCHRVR